MLNQRKKNFVVKTTFVTASMSVLAATGAVIVTDDDIISLETTLISAGMLLIYGFMSYLWFKPAFVAMDKSND